MRILHAVFLLAVATGMALPARLGVPLVGQELDRGIVMAGVASTTQSVFYVRAQEVYSGARAVLPNIHGITREQHEGLNAKVTELRRALDLVWRPGAGGGTPA